MSKALIFPFVNIHKLSSMMKLMFNKTNQREHIYVVKFITKTVFISNLILYTIYDTFLPLMLVFSWSFI